MNPIGDHAMKNRWTISFAAIALVISAFPALASQVQPSAQKSSETKKIERKVDGAAASPFVTKHQGESIKKAVNAGDQKKADEQIAYPDPMQPKAQPGEVLPTPAAPGAEGAPVAQPQPEPEAPNPEEAKPEYRLMGTVCGKKGDDLAVFDKGGEWPAMLKAGDELDASTKVIAVGRGYVTLERVVSPAQAAVPGHLAADGTTVVPARPAQPEKREVYDLYSW